MVDRRRVGRSRLTRLHHVDFSAPRQKLSVALPVPNQSAFDPPSPPEALDVATAEWAPLNPGRRGHPPAFGPMTDSFRDGFAENRGKYSSMLGG
jgi:hypothetical protein